MSHVRGIGFGTKWSERELFQSFKPLEAITNKLSRECALSFNLLVSSIQNYCSKGKQYLLYSNMVHLVKLTFWDAGLSVYDLHLFFKSFLACMIDVYFFEISNIKDVSICWPKFFVV